MKKPRFSLSVHAKDVDIDITLGNYKPNVTAVVVQQVITQLDQDLFTALYAACVKRAGASHRA